MTKYPFVLRFSFSFNYRLLSFTVLIHSNYSFKTVVAGSIHWPAGSYGIPKAASGCPSADGFQWLIGRRYQDTEDNNPKNHKSQEFHLDATVDSKRGIIRSFCMKTDKSTDANRSSWPLGNRCNALIIIAKTMCVNLSLSKKIIK